MLELGLIFSEKCYDNNSEEIKVFEGKYLTQNMIKVSSTNIGDTVYPIDIYLDLEQTEKLIASLTTWVKEVRETYEEIKV